MAKEKKAWVISVDMGYGHQRAAYPLKDIAYERILTANSEKILTKKERKTWRRFQSFYEWVSRIRRLPIIGEIIWRAFDAYQAIPHFYPIRDLSAPTFGSIYMHKLVRKGFLSSVIEYTKKKSLPVVSTFFATALVAAHEKVKDAYCVVTDTDINRIWVPEEPKKDKLYYLAPTENSVRRLMAYGVPEKHIFFTGFPLPKENIGEELEIVKKDLGRRLPNLDPKKRYISRYKLVLKNQLGKDFKTKSDHPLTITYVVGGAGAQKDEGIKIVKSLKRKIKKGNVRVNLVAGTRPEIKQYYEENVEKIGLKSKLGKSINVVFALDKKSYFKEFNQIMHKTDILWTKPSELSFYTALGLPVIITKALGSHETRNQEWLELMGSGFQQKDPKYANEWLFDWLEKGILAEAAWEGFIEAPKFGTYNIEKLLFARNKNKVKFKY